MKLITYTNKAHCEMCRNMLHSFRLHNKKTPITVYSLDDYTRDYFEQYGFETRPMSHVQSKSENLDWSTPDYRQLIQNKFPAIKQELEETGNPVLFVDSDLFFYKNPVPYLNHILQEIPVAAQSDPPHTPICTGFFAVKPVQAVYDVINRVIDYNPATDGAYDDQLRFIRFMIETKTPIFSLPQNLFPNGHTAFIQKQNLPDKYLVHANYMVGHDTKKKALQDIGAWIV